MPLNNLIGFLCNSLKNGLSEFDRIDRLRRGFEGDLTNAEMGYFTESFILFKGCFISKQVLETWKEYQVNFKNYQEYQQIQIPGIITATRSIEYALQCINSDQLFYKNFEGM